MTGSMTREYRVVPRNAATMYLKEAPRLLLAELLYVRNRDTGQLNPKMAFLSERLGWSLTKTYWVLRKLIEAGIVVSTRGQRANRLTIQPPEAWRPQHHSRRVWPSRTRPEVPLFSSSVTVKSQYQDTVESQYQTGPFLIDKETGDYKKREGSAAAAAAQEGTSSVAAADASTPTVKTTNQAVLSETPDPPAPATGGGDPPDYHQATPEAPPSHTEATSWEDMAAALVDELYQSHPKPGHRSRSIPILAGILRRSGAPEATADQIRASHTQWLRYWAYEPARALHLWFWFESKEYLDPPHEAAIQAAHMKSMSFKELEQYRHLLTKNAEIDAKLKLNIDESVKDREFLERAIKQGRIIK